MPSLEEAQDGLVLELPHRAKSTKRRRDAANAQRPNSQLLHPPSPTFPRKFADVDWGSRKRNPNKICAECRPGADFGPYWLLTERLRYVTAPLLPALRDRMHVQGQRDDAHGSHCGSHTASGNRRAAAASRKRHKLTYQLPT